MEEQKTFEESLKELEEIVSKMEAGDMGLEEMVAAFEKGQNLVKICNDRLNEVEHRIDVIRSKNETAPLPPMAE